MFGLEYLIGFIKILMELGLSIVTAIPLTIAWNKLAPIYLDFLPERYLHFPYWHVVGLLLITIYVGAAINRMTPKFVSVSHNVENKNG